MSDTYYTIKTNSNIEHFLEITNSLHDAYLIGVDYVHNGHTGGNPHWIDFTQTELRLRYMVTSKDDQIVELVFSFLQEWQIKDYGFNITDTAVSFTENGCVIWANDQSTIPEIRENGSYVIAGKMKWRFVGS